MRTWMKYGIGIAAVVLALAAGTAAFAIMGDDDGGSGDTASNERQADPQTASDDGGSLGQCAPGVTECNDVASICLEGATDCDDTIDSGDAAGGTCLEGTTDCVDTPGVAGRCLPESPDCDDTISVPMYCEPGQTIEQCFPDGIPGGYECVTLESLPIQVECFLIEGGDVEVSPDCAVSSDGSVSCPEEKPCEDPAGCAGAGSCGSADGQTSECTTDPGCPPDAGCGIAVPEEANQPPEVEPQPAPAQ